MLDTHFGSYTVLSKRRINTLPAHWRRLFHCKARKDYRRVRRRPHSTGVDYDHWNWCCWVTHLLWLISRWSLLTFLRLNLAMANRVFIVEPQWNPSVENQAVARALRLGQKQIVQVTRYVVKGTIEEVGRLHWLPYYGLRKVLICAGNALDSRQEVGYCGNCAQERRTQLSLTSSFFIMFFFNKGSFSIKALFQ